mgnify:FL=1
MTSSTVERKEQTQRRALHHILVISVMSAVPTAFIILAMWNGPGISPDSVSYASAARSLAAGQGFLDFTGEHQSTYAPGLSVFLSVLLGIGVPFNIAVAGTNVVALVATVSLTYFLAINVSLTRSLAIAATIITTWNRTTIEIFSMLWSEVLFVPITLGSVLLLVVAFRRRTLPWSFAIPIAALLSLAVTMRYAGAFFAFAATIASFVVPRDSWRTRLVQGALMGGLPAITLAGIAAINISSGVEPLGDRYPSERSVIGAIGTMTDGLGTTVIWRGSIGITVILGTIALILAAVAGWLSIIQRQATQILTTTAFLYLGVLLWSQADPRIAHGAERLGYPVWPLLVVLVVASIPIFLRTTTQQLQARWPDTRISFQNAAPAVVVITAGALIAGLGVVNGYRYAVDGFRDGIGYNQQSVKNSAVATDLRRIPQSVVVASNEPWLVAWLRPDLISVPLPPSPEEWPAERIARDADRIDALLTSGASVYAVTIPEAHESWQLEDFALIGIDGTPVQRGQSDSGLTVDLLIRQ